jgi:hypothetical protein
MSNCGVSPDATLVEDTRAVPMKTSKSSGLSARVLVWVATITVLLRFVTYQ